MGYVADNSKMSNTKIGIADIVWTKSWILRWKECFHDNSKSNTLNIGTVAGDAVGTHRNRNRMKCRPSS
jgi:hypothetical protein